jgi:hypothetical protein
MRADRIMVANFYKHIPHDWPHQTAGGAQEASKWQPIDESKTVVINGNNTCPLDCIYLYVTKLLVMAHVFPHSQPPLKKHYLLLLLLLLLLLPLLGSPSPSAACLSTCLLGFRL